jgi:hypothetical protein
MDFFLELKLLLNHITTISNNFSNEKFDEWQAGIINDPKKLNKTREGKIHFVDCKNKSYANVVLKLLLDKGVKKEKGSDEGKYLYMINKAD